MGYTTDRASSFSLSNLLCQEDASFLTDDDPDEPTAPSDPLPFFLADDDDEYFEILVARETGTESTTPLPLNHSPPSIQNWLRTVRLDAIEWILKVRVLFCYNSTYPSMDSCFCFVLCLLFWGFYSLVLCLFFDLESGAFWISIPYCVSIHHLFRSGFVYPEPCKISNPSI